ncbi:NAD-dependent deacylase [Neorhodopirellula lusitana]|uniref:NAD-dependent deacylase n=1 Tax=Neorhodopirellula lusitana TaxID=445327 RepID=UPI00384A59B1
MNILILTGAGVSAESGIPTFRDANGLWEGHAFEDVATPEAFARNPVLVHQFYNERRRRLQESDIQPNAAHVALAEFEQACADRDDIRFLLVTQNIDDLHERAGSQNVLHMHGELLKAQCVESLQTYPWKDDLSLETPHPDDPDDESKRGYLRPHVVWFGEMPIGLNQISEAASNADLFLAIGTSGVVYPAAGIVASTPHACRRIEINLDATEASSAFDETIRGPASIEVGKVLQQILHDCSE